MSGETTTLATLWKVTRKDGTTLGFTDHDQDITYNDGTQTVTYHAATGFSPSATEGGSDLSVDNLEVTAFLDSTAINDADIRAGLYNFATIEIRQVNWADLTMGDMKIRKGSLGQVSLGNGVFHAEIRGLTHFLSLAVGTTFGPACRADLGDNKCKVDLSKMIQNGSVASSTSQQQFTPNGGLTKIGTPTPTAPAPAKWFNDGVLVWTSGLNNTYRMEVTNWDGTVIKLFEPMPRPIQAGDTFTIEPGCNKGSDCNSKFVSIQLLDGSFTGSNGNIANKRSEDFIPGQDAILNYPDIKTS
jgi:uncharacterized phage protein (TIGR02218 family)